MKDVHLIIPDLFLPKDFAAGCCADLRLPVLEKMLARGHAETLEAVPLENLLCEMFGVPLQANAPIAPVSAAFDGLDEGCWLRADPAYLCLQRDRLVLQPNMEISPDEAGQFCASLNEYFAGQGMEFFAPHSRRWYVRLNRLADIITVPLSQAAGRNIQGLLPKGKEALHWHRVFNEIQMLLFAHPVNEAREARGEPPVNSVWLWGGGESSMLQQAYDSASSDDILAGMFAAASGAPFVEWLGQWRGEEGDGRQLLVFTGLQKALQSGELAAWCAAVQDFEAGYAQPLWRALRSGGISRLQVDVLGADNARRIALTRADTWAFWRRGKPLAEYSKA